MSGPVEAVEAAQRKTVQIEEAARWTIAVLKRARIALEAGMVTDEEEAILNRACDDALEKLDAALGGVGDATLEEIRSRLRDAG